MRRRMRVIDVLVLPLIWVGQVRREARASARRRRADFRNPGSLTYNRRRAQQLYEQEQPNGP